MNPLEHPDTLHLQAAQGWIELGNHIEANAELENITASLRSHPDVLEVRWGIYYAAKEWEMCAEIGAALVRLAPGRPSSWRHLAASSHFMKHTRTAYSLLLPALELFPEDWSVQYDMACYECVLGDLPAARDRLKKTFELAERHGEGTKAADVRSIKLMALSDPDFEQLWKEIGKI